MLADCGYLEPMVEEEAAAEHRHAKSPPGGSGSDGDGGGGSEPPEGDDDSEFSDEEVERAAREVAALHPDRLTPGLFDDAVTPFVHGLRHGEVGNAKTRVFSALPQSLRMSFWTELGEQLRRAAEASPRAARALGYIEEDSVGGVE